MYRPTPFARTVIALLVAICLVGARTQAPSDARTNELTRASLTPTANALALGTASATTRLHSALHHHGSLEAKQLSHAAERTAPTADPTKSHLLATATLVPAPSPVVLPTSGRSPPLTL